MKNNHYLAFNKEWFEKHQEKLLLLLRFSFFKKILKIETNKPIVEITPNSFTVLLGIEDGKPILQTAFRTHWKYSKLLYFAFSPLWWTMHVLDIPIDIFVPKLSFGLSTLVVNSDANPETTTVDGYVTRNASTEAWATIRAGAGTSFNDTGTQGLAAYVGMDSSNWAQITRSILLFDTSSLTSGVNVSAAVLSVYVSSVNTDFTDSISLVGSTPASNTGLANSDYGNLGTTKYATDLTIASLSTGAFNDFTLNSTGLSNVSKTGITKLGLRTKSDTDNIEPSGTAFQAAGMGIRYADHATDDPIFTVTYALPSIFLPSKIKLTQAIKRASSW